MPGIVANFTSTLILTTLLISWISLTLDFSHSPFLGMCAVLFYGVVLWQFFYTRTFESYIKSYANIPNLTTPAGELPYITGKIIIIDKVNVAIAQLNFRGDFNSGLRANSPDEVGTIIWLECRESATATYEYGSKGYQTTCDVTVIDKARSAIVDKQRFSGASPPSVKTMSGDWHGVAPDDEIMRYIAKMLPRR